MTYIVRSSDGREWGDYGTRSEAQAKLRVLRAEKKRSGFKGRFRIVKKRDNPAVNLPRNWVKADAVRVVRKNGRNVLEIKRNPAKRKAARKPNAAKRKRVLRNVAGYMDANGEFRPIRHSKGYSPEKAGDFASHYGTKKKKKKASRPKPRKKAARRSSTRKRGRK